MNAQPFTSFIMLGSMRSGSNLLEMFLNQYDGLTCHGELFHKSFIGVQDCQNYLGIDMEARNENPQRLLDAVSANNPKKITGFRFFQDHDMQVMEAALKNQYCAKIILTRDPVASFVSLQIAMKTQQWLVSDIAHRRNVQIHFDLEEYATYLTYRTTYYDRIAASLARSEQPYFEIDYTQLNDVESINRLAAFIGDRAGRATLNEPIKRQNPGALASKISNIEEVRRALDAPSLSERPPPILTPILESGTDLSRAYFSRNNTLVFGPVPGVPDKGVRKWLEAQNSGALENGFSSHKFAEWKAKNKSPTFFSAVRHPVLRAYNAFMLKVFATTSDSYIAIRQDLENQFGIILPQGKISPEHDRHLLERNGYGVEEHRISFKLFLIFVAANLNNKTKIRQDGKWQLQTEIIRRYRILHPDVIVLKEKNLSAGLKYLSNLLNFSPIYNWTNEPDPAFSFPLSEIYDAEVEALAREAYGQDYLELGYDDLY
ncbi:MAG: hypothetical protein COB08_006260 [Rhodobacteraceae bacterium]|nr:hypothetical protein [Paracoccaceae bacterium]